ncbi:MAG TPA: hypothetical protein DEO88_13580 [Syntrophobacteraceae bacterium]|jgi:hypothetical protein|nr:hypothetical protein [Syntrophobacteraceae bacterium]
MEKRLVGGFLGLLAVFLVAGPALAQVDLNQGLVAWYPFNGNALDESGNRNDGGVHGSTLTAELSPGWVQGNGTHRDSLHFEALRPLSKSPRSTRNEASQPNPSTSHLLREKTGIQELEIAGSLLATFGVPWLRANQD